MPTPRAFEDLEYWVKRLDESRSEYEPLNLALLRVPLELTLEERLDMREASVETQALIGCLVHALAEYQEHLAKPWYKKLFS